MNSCGDWIELSWVYRDHNPEMTLRLILMIKNGLTRLEVRLNSFIHSVWHALTSIM